MTDLKSLLGYADFSPFRNNPYLDINTPEGYITMADTSHDLLGIDNLGNTQLMKARRKKPYKFPGTRVREIPMQVGGYPSGDIANRGIRPFLVQQNVDKAQLKKQIELQALWGTPYDNQATISSTPYLNDYQKEQKAAIRKTKNEQFAATSDKYNVNDAGDLVPSKLALFDQKYGKNMDKFARSLETPLALESVVTGVSALYNLAEKAIAPSLRKLTSLARESLKNSPEYTSKVLSEVEEGNNWLRDWYSNPISKERYDNFVEKANNIYKPEYAKSQADFLRYAKSTDFPGINGKFSESFLRRLDAIEARDNYNSLLKGKNIVEHSDEALSKEGDVLGRYSPGKNTAQVDVYNPKFHPNYPNKYKPMVSNTTVHEGIHKITRGDNALKPKMAGELQSAFKTKGLDLDEYDAYLTEPTEIHARVGELRKQFGLKPEQEVSKEILQHIYKAGISRETSVDPRFFDLVRDKEKLRWIFNNAPVAIPAIAGAAAIKQSKRYGGKIPKMQKAARNVSTQEGEDYKTATGYYQMGGAIPNKNSYATKLFKYIFDDNSYDSTPTIPISSNPYDQPIEEDEPKTLEDKYMQDQADFESAMSVLLDNNEDIFSNPYGDTNLNYD